MFPVPPPLCTAAPVPVKLIDAAGLVWPLTVAVRGPVAAPAAVGENVTLAVAVPPLPATLTLVGVTLKGAVAASVTVADAVVVLVSVTVCGALVALTLAEKLLNVLRL